uniref:xin actin-binding repeat-containing protein 1-like isoform X2 n=1 Tax=Myxine glutinosa TaxID=7769 RepID=UPI00358F96C5
MESDMEMPSLKARIAALQTGHGVDDEEEDEQQEVANGFTETSALQQCSSAEVAQAGQVHTVSNSMEQQSSTTSCKSSQKVFKSEENTRASEQISNSFSSSNKAKSTTEQSSAEDVSFTASSPRTPQTHEASSQNTTHSTAVSKGSANKITQQAWTTSTIKEETSKSTATSSASINLRQNNVTPSLMPVAHSGINEGFTSTAEVHPSPPPVTPRKIPPPVPPRPWHTRPCGVSPAHITNLPNPLLQSYTSPPVHTLPNISSSVQKHPCSPPHASPVAPSSSASPESRHVTSSPALLPALSYEQQRQLSEFRRLSRHIHPEVQRRLEQDFLQDLKSAMMEETRRTTLSAADQKCLEKDEMLRGEVRSMRWVFETHPLDAICDPTAPPPGAALTQKAVLPGDVRYTTWRFETQPLDALASREAEGTEEKVPELARGDVQTATHLFETQSLAALSGNDGDMRTKEEVSGVDVKLARRLFETQTLAVLGRWQGEPTLLRLKSEIEEIRGGHLRTTVQLFDAHPLCAIRDGQGCVHQITGMQREEVEDLAESTGKRERSVHWLFETQAFESTVLDTSTLHIVRGISMDELEEGQVGQVHLLFEKQSLDQLQKEEEQDGIYKDKRVKHHCWLFETQAVDSISTNETMEQKKEVVGGNVRRTLWLFETPPMDLVKGIPEVGKLKTVMSTVEHRDVRRVKWLFETHSLDSICQEETEAKWKVIHRDDTEKGEVKSFRNVFETVPLDSIKASDESTTLTEVTKDIIGGDVTSTKSLFESVPLYAIKDYSGHYHKLCTVRREEVLEGDVRACRWMFETKPLDQFEEESRQKVQIIRGISKQEIQSGDVKMAKWLFETCPLDAIQQDEKESVHLESLKGGDVKMCRWLFETQPMDALYERVDSKLEEDDVVKGDVKLCTWLFESQPLDTLSSKDREYRLKARSVRQEEVFGVDAQRTRFMFESEPLDSIYGGIEESQLVKTITKIDVQSGDVSRVRRFFENCSLDSIKGDDHDETADVTKKTVVTEDIQKGDVSRCTWLFETQPMETICEDAEASQKARTVTDIQGGDVYHCTSMFETHPMENISEKYSNVTRRCTISDVLGGDVKQGRFVFETQSLDKIRGMVDDDFEGEIESRKTVGEIINGDVKTCRMLFETQPLYAIRDREGHFHEVVTVRKEEIIRGDVNKARWLFETKPLDSIKAGEEVHIIRSVTQEDVGHSNVGSARWQFETQPLDTINDYDKSFIRTVDSADVGNVHEGTRVFESGELANKKYVRTVSMSDVKSGDVRTSLWLFETRNMDSLGIEQEEKKELTRVKREDVEQGDVRRSLWMFETQPLHKICEKQGSEDNTIQREEIQGGDVKTSTCLFEKTPLHELGGMGTQVEKPEILGKNINDTLNSLMCCNLMECSQGIILEPSEMGNVCMTKYRLQNPESSPQIQKEEIIHKDIRNILEQLLIQKRLECRSVVVDEEEHKNIQETVEQLMNQTSQVNVEKEEIVRGDIHQAINNLFSQSDSGVQKGVLLQENEKGDIRMTIYSLLNQDVGCEAQKEQVISGNVKETIESLFQSMQKSCQEGRVNMQDIQQGNVHFFTTCIESGGVDYLRSLQGLGENNQQEKDIKPGDVESTKTMLALAASKPIVVDKEEIVRANLEKTFMSLEEAMNATKRLEKEEITGADIANIFQSLQEAINSKFDVQKEHVMRADMRTILYSLKQSINKQLEIAKEEVVHGDLQAALHSLNEAQTAVRMTEKEEVIKGDIQIALRSLQDAIEAKIEINKEEIVAGNVHAAMQSLQETITSKPVVVKKDIERADLLAIVHGLEDSINAKVNLAREEVICGNIEAALFSLQEAQNVVRQSQKDKVIGVDLRTIVGSLEDAVNAKVNFVREEIVKGDIQAALESLEEAWNLQASVEKEEVTRADLQAILMSLQEKIQTRKWSGQEEILKGDVKAAIHSLQEAINGKMALVKEDIIKGDIPATLRSIEEAINAKIEVVREEVVRGDLQAALKSLEEATNTMTVTKREDTVRGNLQATLRSLEEAKTRVRLLEKEKVLGASMPIKETVGQDNGEADIEMLHTHATMPSDFMEMEKAVSTSQTREKSKVTDSVIQKVEMLDAGHHKQTSGVHKRSHRVRIQNKEGKSVDDNNRRRRIAEEQSSVCARGVAENEIAVREVQKGKQRTTFTNPHHVTTTDRYSFQSKTDIQNPVHQSNTRQDARHLSGISKHKQQMHTSKHEREEKKQAGVDETQTLETATHDDRMFAVQTPKTSSSQAMHNNVKLSVKGDHGLSEKTHLNAVAVQKTSFSSRETRQMKETHETHAMKTHGSYMENPKANIIKDVPSHVIAKVDITHSNKPTLQTDSRSEHSKIAWEQQQRTKRQFLSETQTVSSSARTRAPTDVRSHVGSSLVFASSLRAPEEELPPPPTPPPTDVLMDGLPLPPPPLPPPPALHDMDVQEFPPPPPLPTLTNRLASQQISQTANQSPPNANILGNPTTQKRTFKVRTVVPSMPALPVTSPIPFRKRPQNKTVSAPIHDKTGEHPIGADSHGFVKMTPQVTSIKSVETCAVSETDSTQQKSNIHIESVVRKERSSIMPKHSVVERVEVEATEATPRSTSGAQQVIAGVETKHKPQFIKSLVMPPSTSADASPQLRHRSHFKTPLIIAEENFRRQQIEKLKGTGSDVHTLPMQESSCLNVEGVSNMEAQSQIKVMHVSEASQSATTKSISNDSKESHRLLHKQYGPESTVDTPSHVPKELELHEDTQVKTIKKEGSENHLEKTSTVHTAKESWSQKIDSSTCVENVEQVDQNRFHETRELISKRKAQEPRKFKVKTMMPTEKTCPGTKRTSVSENEYEEVKTERAVRQIVGQQLSLFHSQQLHKTIGTDEPKQYYEPEGESSFPTVDVRTATLQSDSQGLENKSVNMRAEEVTKSTFSTGHKVPQEPRKRMHVINIGSHKNTMEPFSRHVGQASQDSTTSQKAQIKEKQSTEEGLSFQRHVACQSPTFITIESARKLTEPMFPVKTPPSPPPRRYYSPVLTPPPPPLSPYLITSPLPPSPISPSPSPTNRRRVEKLARLRDTTSKLSQGAVSPSTQHSHSQVTTRRSEIVQSPPALRRQIMLSVRAVKEPTKEGEAVLETMESGKKQVKHQQMFEGNYKVETRQGHEKENGSTSKWLEDCRGSFNTSHGSKPKGELSHLNYRFDGPQRNAPFPRDGEMFSREKRNTISEGRDWKAGETCTSSDNQSVSLILESNKNQSYENMRHQTTTPPTNIDTFPSSQRKAHIRPNTVAKPNRKTSRPDVWVDGTGSDVSKHRVSIHQRSPKCAAAQNIDHRVEHNGVKGGDSPSLLLQSMADDLSSLEQSLQEAERMLCHLGGPDAQLGPSGNPSVSTPTVPGC